ncbi:cation-translocating P-type ATPase [Salsipaludibacter albus]|uniref:cation-translocating P-type ATPase n=1 Tax=Salsipaludibacter albus TaxID=2849650 RepID=UPI001EE41F47|nr:cation-translocating P-type ATPase [Salsipaludibacter albus]MBY5163267.1 cation-translocating P-type ATPase [Salsipaludibacter albus]
MSRGTEAVARRRTSTDATDATAADVAAAREVDPTRGLGVDEAARRLARHGPNTLPDVRPVSTWRRLLAQVRSPLVLLLLVAVVVSLVVWLAEGRPGVPVDAVVITAIVVANALLGLVQELKAGRAVAALRRLASPTATVVRAGVRVRVRAADVVPGDVLVVSGGDVVAADARLVGASGLRVAEAVLTGESAPVDKDATSAEPATQANAPLGERRDMVFAGTAVVEGDGTAVVTRTGSDTEMGRIADLLHRTPSVPTPLEAELARLGRILGVGVVVVAAIVVGTVSWSTPPSGTEDLVEVLLLGVSLAVAAVPEGLPAVLSVVLALGVRRMAARNAIVTHLSSVETLGSATVVCTDKTGTLTRNEMAVERVVTPSGEVVVTGNGLVPDGAFLLPDGAPLGAGALFDEVATLLGAAGLASDADLHEDDGRWVLVGDPTEGALLVAERKLGTADGRRQRFDRTDTIPFSGARKRMSVMARDREGDDERPLLVTKGAPDVLLDLCTHVRVGGAVAVLDDRRAERIRAEIDRLASAAYRILGVAARRLDEPPDRLGDSLEHDLAWLGMVGIIDPPRAEAGPAIASARAAGVRVVMITGDHPSTGRRIARDLGIVDRDGPGTGSGRPVVLTGPELDRLDDDGLADAVREVAVFARVAPAHKLRIVHALQADGEVVAMTGDGVNDAPALKAADLGVAMGRSGTDVARGAARMILADDDFATIVAAIREGRGIFDHVRSFLRYLLSSNTGEVLALFVGVVAAGWLGLSGHGDGIAAPLLAVQILWVNLLTDLAPALAMGLDPVSDDVMDRPPRRRGDRVVDGPMVRDVLVIGAVMALVTLAAVDLYLPGGMLPGTEDLATARTAGFTVLVLAQLFNVFNARSARHGPFHGLFTNRWLWVAVVASALAQVAVVHVPALNVAFSTVPLTAGQWMVCVGLASLVLVVGVVRHATRSWLHG